MRPRIAMYVPYLYPVVSGGKVPFAGGIEVQLSLLAKGLVRRGFDVTVATCDFGQERELVVDGVRLVRCWAPDAGLPVVRFFHPRLSSTVHALWAADADAYLYQGAALGAGIVYDVARLRGRASVFLVGHDHDVLASLPDVHGARDRAWFRRALRGADLIVSQTIKQQQMLREAFGRDSEVLMNPVEVPAEAAAPGEQEAVVWVATYKDAKRPDWFTRFAESHPDVRCVMAGVIPVPPLSDREYRDACAVASRCPNLEVRSTIPHEQIPAFLRGAGLFTHTSPAEGFPNAFLEAWASGLPTVTCFDPDGIIVRERLGECHDTYEGWEAAVLRYVRDRASRAEAGARARTYAAEHHGAGVIHDRLADMLHRTIAARR